MSTRYEGNVTAANTEPIAAAAEAEVRCARRAEQQEARWHQSGAGKQVQAKEICTGSSSSSVQLVKGAHAGLGVTSVEMKSAKAVRVAGLFLDINFLHGRRARKGIEQPEPFCADGGFLGALLEPLGATRAWGLCAYSH